MANPYLIALKKSIDKTVYWFLGNITYCCIPLSGIFLIASWDKVKEVIGDGFLVFLGCALMASIGIDIFLARELISNRSAFMINAASLIAVPIAQTLMIVGSLVFCFATKIVLTYIEEIQKIP
jgi:hypothetical protein